MLISNENFVRSNFVATQTEQTSAKYPIAFSLLLEQNEIRIENDQSSALSFNALGMFGNFDTIKFIESSPSLHTAQNDTDFITDNSQTLYKPREANQYLNTVIVKQKLQNLEYNLSNSIIEYAKNSKNPNNLTFKNYSNSSVIQRFETGFRSVGVNSSISVYSDKMPEQEIKSFQLHISQKDSQFFVSLTGFVFDLTNSLKMRDIASSILEKFGIKNGILYINAINVTKAYYFIREENHGSGTR